jgi:hypothetical protein
MREYERILRAAKGREEVAEVILAKRCGDRIADDCIPYRTCKTCSSTSLKAATAQKQDCSATAFGLKRDFVEANVADN